MAYITNTDSFAGTFDTGLDFLNVSCVMEEKKGQPLTLVVKPKFILGKNRKKVEDIMVKGGAFYAIWDYKNNIWTTDETIAINLIDEEIDDFVERQHYPEGLRVSIKHLWDTDSGSIDKFHKFVTTQLTTEHIDLDTTLVFSNTQTDKYSYSSVRLPYALEEGSIDAYTEMFTKLYEPAELHKLEWAIGAVVTGDSKDIQKFIVLYGPPKSGKGTFLKLIKKLFKPYCASVTLKTVTSNSEFSLAEFIDNPLIGLDEDCNLSEIKDNTKLNSIVSHEMQTMNAKFKNPYPTQLHTFLFAGSNSPVKITDSYSGIIRRLIDVTPTEETHPVKRYNELMKQIDFELGAIAWHCKDIYESNPTAYDNYRPLTMIQRTDYFYMFMEEQASRFMENDYTTLGGTWMKYQEWVNDTGVKDNVKRTKSSVKEELKSYFKEYSVRIKINGVEYNNYYSGFKKELFKKSKIEGTEVEKDTMPLGLDTARRGTIDSICASCPAQYATEDGKPSAAWDNVKTVLSDLDPTRLHYVRVPINHIVIDFDIPNKDGTKSLKRNLEEAAKFPPTYTELSKSGGGVHLHYIYKGDPEELSSIYDDHIEIKVFKGKSSLRRKLTKCNQLPIATISNLPLKEKKDKMVDGECLKNEKALSTLIKRAIAKEYGATVCCVQLVKKELDKAYEAGMSYNVMMYKPALLEFAEHSTHNADECKKMVRSMHFISKDQEDSANLTTDTQNKIFAFFDVEVFPNYNCLCVLPDIIKPFRKEDVMAIHNPTSKDISRIVDSYNLIGFNNLRYDNYIMYAIMSGLSAEEVYDLSQSIIANKNYKGIAKANAKGISYTDIFDFSSVKQSLKKFEIEMDGVSHHELGYRWDEPVHESQWDQIADYCKDDVIATANLFYTKDRQADFMARKILAELANANVNNTTNELTTKIIFGDNRNPQSVFHYRDLAEPRDDMPYFEGYKFDNGVSMYRGEEVGEGGFVWAKPGMYFGRIVTFDVASMHPHSILAENLFGPYTENFKKLMDARIAIKHKDYQAAKDILGEKAAKYLNEDDPKTAKVLSSALKIAINSVYGLTSAKFTNAFRDVRNIDNIVAKRGALFMLTLRDELLARGAKVIHIKTDSIKIVDPSEDISNFVFEFAKKYGYEFEIEHIFDRICLVNNAVYIAKLHEDDDAGTKEWTATGTQFQIPYVFKTLFSHEPIEFKDVCETKSVKTAMYLEDSMDGNKRYSFVGKVGSFCPMQEGHGRKLVRDQDEKKVSVVGCKDWYWEQAEDVQLQKLEGFIEKRYYMKLVDDAIDTIKNYGDYEKFVAD